MRDWDGSVVVRKLSPLPCPLCGSELYPVDGHAKSQQDVLTTASDDAKTAYALSLFANTNKFCKRFARPFGHSGTFVAFCTF
jgi:hypothetical protein